MLDALVGAVIMVVATTSLLYSIEVSEKAFADAGRYPLTRSERDMLKAVGLNNPVSQDNFLVNNINWCSVEKKCSK
tara:strand:+ start:432 stop:659 length:228 start_codon:yes stop_codon:yes gene_type:complete